MRAKGGAESPEAVCTAQLGDASYEAVTTGTGSALLRAGQVKSTISFREVARKAKVREANSGGVVGNPQGEEVDVIIIREGPGNLSDRHWYTREAIMSGVKVFEGQKAFVDHPDSIEEQVQPERKTRDLVGYYHSLQTKESVHGELMLVGKLRMAKNTEAANDARSLVELADDHRKRYGDEAKPFFGISINADGESREAVINGERWNAVTTFTEATSADIVTFPAAGGKFLGLLESMRAARLSGSPKEVSKMKTEAVREGVKTMRAMMKKIASENDEAKRAQFAAEAEGYMKAMDEQATEDGDVVVHAKPGSGDGGDDGNGGTDAEQEAKKKEMLYKKEQEAKKKASEAAEEEAKRKAAEAEQEEEDEATEAALTQGPFPVTASAAEHARELKESAKILRDSGHADKADKLEAQASKLTEGRGTGQYSKLRKAARVAEAKAFVYKSTLTAQQKLAEAGLSASLINLLIGKTDAEQDAVIESHKAILEEALSMVETRIEGAPARTGAGASSAGTSNQVSKALKESGF